VSRTMSDLLAVLDLEQLEVDLFRGRSPETSLQRIFGGQVAAQALVAAGRTVDAERGVHSLHAYFLRAGDTGAPVVYQVERIRDGGSFSTRRVVAVQHGRPIFFMSASFQGAEAGLDHQDPMPRGVPGPDDLPDLEARIATGHPVWSAVWRDWQAIDFRHVADSPFDGVGDRTGAHSPVWIRAAEPLPDDPLLQVCVLAYASDLTLLFSALGPHPVTPLDLQMASIDHAMWFHRPFRADEWLLYDQESPSASGGRGLARGRVFTRDGRLVASVVQEGLVRPRRAR
jgi:acyl-CoA thioesterase II